MYCYKVKQNCFCLFVCLVSYYKARDVLLPFVATKTRDTVLFAVCCYKAKGYGPAVVCCYKVKGYGPAAVCCYKVKWYSPGVVCCPNTRSRDVLPLLFDAQFKSGGAAVWYAVLWCLANWRVNVLLLFGVHYKMKGHVLLFFDVLLIDESVFCCCLVCTTKWRDMCCCSLMSC